MYEDLGGKSVTFSDVCSRRRNFLSGGRVLGNILRRCFVFLKFVGRCRSAARFGIEKVGYASVMSRPEGELLFVKLSMFSNFETAPFWNPDEETGLVERSASAHVYVIHTAGIDIALTLEHLVAVEDGSVAAEQF